MSNTIEISVPDIGDVSDVEVIEILVAVGDAVKPEQSLITVESDKASMEIPSPQGGVVESIVVKTGDKVKQGSAIIMLKAEQAEQAEQDEAKAAASASDKDQKAQSQTSAAKDQDQGQKPDSSQGESSSTAVVAVPDIGDSTDVEVIEIMVAVGDTVKAEQSLITVESDKASMEVPSSHSGVITAIKVKLGDKVNQGSEILELSISQSGSASAGSAKSAAAASSREQTHAPAQQHASETRQESGADGRSAAASASESSNQNGSPAARPSPTAAFSEAPASLRNLPHASPSVRKFARELGVDLSKVTGTGNKQRITQDDVRQFVKQALAGGSAPAQATAAGGLSVLPWPKVDFTKFGPIESKPLSRIKKISGANLHRNWVMIPHVTNNERADITELENFRVQLNTENQKSGIKLTMLAFLIKASVAALKKFPEFNASLDGDNLVLKQYYHIGFAADTPNGLVVPVIRDADKKGINELAHESGDLAKLARDGKLAPTQMQGGCFSISSLGGIGGTTFTPIINAPEVAILGVSRSSTEPVWDGKQFQPRLMLPLSLSYDHRVIDGASAARFNAYLASLLADFRRIAL
jgi:pyruvate dehydrogenase E2 component (dihydrolipoamide acetyltransferase)